MQVRSLSIKSKLFLVFIFLSGIAFIVSIKLTQSYGIKEEEEFFGRIENAIYTAYGEPLSHYVLEQNFNQTQKQMNNLASLDEVISANLKVKDSDLVITAHNPKFITHQPESIEKKYTLTDDIGNNILTTGTLTIYYNKNISKNRIENRLKFFIPLQLLRTFLVALVAFIVFHNLVVRRINNLAEYLKNINHSQFSANQKLKSRWLPPILSAPDELSYLYRITKKLVRHTSENYKNLNAKLSKAEKQIEIERIKSIHASKMAALGEMAAGISHEINNPLQVISGRLTKTKRFAKELNEEKKQQLEFEVEKIESMIFRIERIIRGLRTFARDASQDQSILINLNNLISDSEELLRLKLSKKNIQLILDCSEDLILECRPVEISQAIVNLVNNAAEAITNDIVDRWVLIKTYVEKNFVIIQIIDSGHGVSQDIQNKIMNPFFTTKIAENSSGLGLPICKGIAESHGGTLTLKTEFQKTCFEIRLPKFQKSTLTTAV